MEDGDVSGGIGKSAQSLADDFLPLIEQDAVYICRRFRGRPFVLRRGDVAGRVGITDHVQVKILDAFHVGEGVGGFDGLMGAAKVDDCPDAVLDQIRPGRLGEIVETIGAEEGAVARGLAVQRRAAAEIADVVCAGDVEDSTMSRRRV